MDDPPLAGPRGGVVTWVLVAVGGAVGAAARFALDVGVSRFTGPHWPWGTLTVNVVGSALLGVVIGLAPGERGLALLAVGTCGALTTASTFTWEALGLLVGRRRWQAGAYVLATVVLTAGALIATRSLVAQ